MSSPSKIQESIFERCLLPFALLIRFSWPFLCYNRQHHHSYRIYGKSYSNNNICRSISAGLMNARGGKKGTKWRAKLF